MWLYYYGFCGDGVFEMTRLLVDDGLYFGQQLVELEDADAKISLVAFRVVAQLVHCTKEWYSSHWARRSSAGRTRKLLRSSSSWDAAVNPQETLKIHADTYSNDKIHCQPPAQRLSNWTPLRTCAITMATSKQNKRLGNPGDTQKPAARRSRTNRYHENPANTQNTCGTSWIITHSVAWP